jgi:hypothetical protein
MIVFDLICSPAGHVFEAWFGSSPDYESQRQRGLVSCPLCGSGSVEKAVMAPRLGAKGNQARQDLAVQPVVAPDPGAVKEMLAAVAAVQKQMLASSTYVGESFAAEARAIHSGEAEIRSIHGSATWKETAGLLSEGIQIFPLPLPVVEPGQEN